MQTNKAGRRSQPDPLMVTMRIFFGMIFLLPGLCGGAFYIESIVDWVIWSFKASGPQYYQDAFLFFAVPSIWLSIFLVGILFRHAYSPAAPKASLVLSVIAVIVFAFALLILLPNFLHGPVGENLIVLFFGFLGVGLAAVPPFLFWRSAVLASPKARSHSEVKP
jgi:predicted neutral ceramidase superfamily lipid hydrolase